MLVRCEDRRFGTKVRRFPELKTFLEGPQMKTSLSEDSVSATVERLRSSNRDFMARYPGEEGRRQPVHTVYGGAHLFRADSARRLGQVAETSLT